MIRPMIGHAQELIVVDTGSTDGTLEIADKYQARIYQVGFTDFGKIRTLTAHLARMDWVLMLDADEILTRPDLLQKVISTPDYTNPNRTDRMPDAIAVPRRRWLDLEMTKQTELEAYPDRQVRLFRNNPDFIYRRALHEEFHNGHVTLYDGPMHIEHFQDVFKDEEANRIRQELYERLAPEAGVHLHGGKVVDDDQGEAQEARKT
jgi:glycosyltransferase involved in cell wall biosynthesis